MPVYCIDPLSDPRWLRLTERHPSASVFHSSGWLRALQVTYGYEPIAYTLSPPGAELANGVVFSRICSWATGRRMVSLPFSDHCEPLVDRSDDAIEILDYVRTDAASRGCRFVEIRPTGYDGAGLPSALAFGVSQTFVLHRIDLRAALDELFHRFHKSCIQRKIRRAQREKLNYVDGYREDLLQVFFDLLLKTRRKHQLPPPPISWFRSLIHCLGSKVRIRVALKGDQPVAAVLTLAWANTLIYKYACSDCRYNNLGGTALLIWKAIKEAKSCGQDYLDLGRCDLDNQGLAKFKERWAATRMPLQYWRSPAPSRFRMLSDWTRPFSDRVFERLPDRLLASAGNILYRHMG